MAFFVIPQVVCVILIVIYIEHHHGEVDLISETEYTYYI